MPNLQAPADYLYAMHNAHGIVRLSVEDQILLVEAILNPPEPNEALRKAAASYNRIVVESR
jgi:uncharacterized protein (DUF1778 family)